MKDCVHNPLIKIVKIKCDKCKAILESYEEKVYHCLRCGHIWSSKSKDKPKTCANKKCRSPYWDRPRQLKK